jgi:hypothetical protein
MLDKVDARPSPFGRIAKYPSFPGEPPVVAEVREMLAAQLG